jgi:dynein heavy chain, axonemal
MGSECLQASRNSFQVLKERLRPSTSGQQNSFFDVEVNLKVPSVVVSPSLDEIQEAVNTCAKKVSFAALNTHCV